MAGGDCPSVSFDLTVDDWMAAYKRASSGERWRLFWGILKLGLALLGLALLGFLLGSVVFGTVMIGLFALLGTAFFPRFPISLGRRACRANPYILGRRNIRIETNGLMVDGEHVQSLYRWHVVNEVSTGAGHAFLRLAATTWLPLPRRAFPSDAEFDAFVAEIRRRAGEFQQPPREPR